MLVAVFLILFSYASGNCLKKNLCFCHMLHLSLTKLIFLLHFGMIWDTSKGLLFILPPCVLVLMWLIEIVVVFVVDLDFIADFLPFALLQLQ